MWAVGTPENTPEPQEPRGEPSPGRGQLVGGCSSRGIHSVTCQPGLAPNDSSSKKPHKQTGKATGKQGAPVPDGYSPALL